MNGEYVDKNNYDVVSISRPGKEKRTNYIHDAQHIDKSQVTVQGKFIRVFADIFLKKEASGKAYT